MTRANPFPASAFRRYDEAKDEAFYSMPRRVVHIDEGAIHTLTAWLAKLLPPGGVYLDLMSSWRSHLPNELNPARVVGLGMNAAEMIDNPQLDAYLVHDLNENPTLPLPATEFDAAICTVSVQYMTQPFAVFQEVNRVLKPDGLFILSFSNRCFATKAVAAWLNSSDKEHLDLVDDYFTATGNWTTTETAIHTPYQADPLYAIWARKGSYMAA